MARPLSDTALLALVLALAAGPLRAACQFDAAGEIVNPFDASCGGMLWTYVEAPGQGADTLALGYPVPRPVDSLTPVDGFRSFDSLHARHQDLVVAFPDRVRDSVVGRSLRGENLFAYRIGDLDDRTVAGLPEAAILVTGGIHAREWQTPEAVTELFERLVGTAADQGFGSYLHDNLNVVLVPVLNVDGFRHTQAEFDRVSADPQQPREGRMRRKNLRDPQTLGAIDTDITTVADNFWGIDLNRNSAQGHGLNGGSTTRRTSLIYRGEQGPASEPEIDALENEATGAASLGPPSRLRLYSDTHSFSRIFFTVLTGNARRDAITVGLMNAMRAVSDNRYRDGRDPVAGLSSIGTTADHFGYRYQIPSWTLELEPLNGGQDYGGLATHAHSGFILPDAEVARMRAEVTRMYLLGSYRQAGPPHALAVEISELVGNRVVYAAEWQPNGAVRALQVTVDQALVPGTAYRLWLAFDKPMRWRDAAGAIARYPGQSSGPATGAATLEIPVIGERLDLDVGRPQVWQDAPGGAPAGFHRYRDDALAVEFTLPQGTAVASPTRAVLSLSNADLAGLALDADPATPVDWAAGHWTGYEDARAMSGDVGGTDCSFQPFVATDPSAVAPAGSATCAAAQPPPPPAPPPSGGGGVLFWLLAAGWLRRR